jgi:TonB family protein
MAAAAGTALWEPDLAKLTSNLGLKYADDAVAASFTASSIGLLESLFSRIRSKETWQPSWVEAEIPEEDLAAPEAEEAQERFVPPTSAAFRAKPSLPSENAGPPPPVVPKPPRPVPTPVIETMDEPAVEIPVPGAVASAVAAAPEPPDVLHSAPPPPDPSAPSFPLPGSAPTAAPVRKPPPVMAIPKAAVTSLPFEAAEVTVLPPQDEKEMTKSRLGFYVAVVAGAALVFAAIAVVVDARMEKMKEQDRAQEEAKAHHLAEVQLERAEHLAKVKEAQSRQEVQTAIVQTQKTTEEATRKSLLAEMEAKRIADLPGGLSLATSPAGASVSIDGKPPIASPLVLTGLSPGPHRIRIVLARHDPVELTTEIKASKTSDLGTITLESALGVLAVTSSPDDLEFAVRPAANPSGAPLRTGRTPASLEGIPRGDYLVTYARPGCRDHVEKASVRKGAKGAVDTKYLDGSLELTSDPSGAWVDKDGIRLGSTPLVLHDLTPKEAFFQLTLPGYDPTPVSCAIPEGQTIKMNAQLLRRDRVFTVGEVKSLPSSYISPPPELTAAERKTDAEVTVSLIVQRDGTVVDVKVEKATDDDIGRRCANAVSRWKFHPGTASDDRTVDVQLEVPFRFAALP